VTGCVAEEAFVASLSCCHMLTWLFLAGRAGYDVESYRDEAVGVMTKNEQGVPWVSAVTLNPVIVYAGRQPDAAENARLHHLAHEQCYIANSTASIEYARRNWEQVKTLSPRAMYMDTTTATQFNESYEPGHTQTRSQDEALRQEFMRLVHGRHSRLPAA